ncbi:MAG TPA: bifunctional riboflavin kinase/FAD synthetase [Egibacteraceae bacterium]|nr:bifunctional riboflavin kinase/FAD synthetase [Egibacteraceae bacterium]
MTRAQIVRGLEAVPPGPSVVAIGFFDGVHRGHQTIIRRAVRAGQASGVRSAVVTFDRHPMEVVNPGSQPKLLMTLARRAGTLAEQGVDLVVVMPFDDDVRHLSPEGFVDHVLVDPLQAQRVVVGANFRFGHRAAGDVATLSHLGPSRGFDAEGVTLLELDGVVISSTEIRGAVEQGDVALAARMLGRPPSIDGVVVRGNQRGAGLGYPTANVQVDARLAVPARGIYAGEFTLDGDRRPCVTNVGVNPTFGGQELRVEAHLLDFDGDLYGREVSVDFRHRIRDEEKFDSVEQLVAQIDADAAEARRLLGLT